MSDEKFYSLIADELEHGKTDRMLWTRALGKSDGDADRTKAYYINARLAALKLTDTAVPPGLQLDNQKAPGSKMAADSRLLLLRGELAEALQDKSGQWLSELTHMESPWKDARGDLKPTERGDNVIPLAAMHEYYSSL